MTRTKSRSGSKISQWPSRGGSIGRVGTEYATVQTEQPRLLLWIRRQSAYTDKRERLGNTFRTIHQRLESTTQQALSKILGDLGQKVMDRFSAAGTVAVQVSELWHDAELAIPFNHAMKPCWLRMLEAGVHFEADWVGAVKPQFYRSAIVQHQLPSIDVGLSPFLQAQLAAFLNARTVGVWSEVSKTIHKRIETTLANGLRDGLTLKEMTSQLQMTMKSIKEYQSKRIARTETTGGMNAGGHLERIDLGIQHKEWVSTLDRRTRGARAKDRFDHISSNGEIVVNADPFMVSGQKLLYPADGSLGASAGNICNCRCCSVGAWPSSPLKPTSAPVAAPDVPDRPADWHEPDYEKAVKLDSPLPYRTDRELKKSNLREMDTEQRTQQTADRVNSVRDVMSSKNDQLETARQAVLKTGSAIENAQNRLDQVYEKINEWRRSGSNDIAVLDQLTAEKNQAKADLAAVTAGTRTQMFKSIAPPKTADIVMTVKKKLSDEMKDKAQQASEFFGSLLSDKHGPSFHIPINTTTRRRAYQLSGNIYMNGAAETKIWAHEIAHIVEGQNQKVLDLCKGFLYHRVGDEQASIIYAKHPEEVGTPDDWAKTFGSSTSAKYCGKWYPDATEILSKGVEMLYADPVLFAKLDPEYFKFVTGILNGTLL